MEMICKYCRHFNNRLPIELDGICEKSKTDNDMFEAHDDLEEQDPYLAVSENFGCLQWERRTY